jgi:hypothetical protein
MALSVSQQQIFALVMVPGADRVVSPINRDFALLRVVDRFTSPHQPEHRQSYCAECSLVTKEYKGTSPDDSVVDSFHTGRLFRL